MFLIQTFTSYSLLPAESEIDSSGCQRNEFQKHGARLFFVITRVLHFYEYSKVSSQEKYHSGGLDEKNSSV